MLNQINYNLFWTTHIKIHHLGILYINCHKVYYYYIHHLIYEQFSLCWYLLTYNIYIPQKIQKLNRAHTHTYTPKWARTDLLGGTYHFHRLNILLWHILYISIIYRYGIYILTVLHQMPPKCFIKVYNILFNITFWNLFLFIYKVVIPFFLLDTLLTY